MFIEKNEHIEKALSTLWTAQNEWPLTAQSLEALFNNEIPCVRIENFAAKTECSDFVAAVDTVLLRGVSWPVGLTKFVDGFGVQFNHERIFPKEEYFAGVEPSYVAQEAVFQHCGLNPITRLIEYLEHVAPDQRIAIADEPTLGRYFVGLIRDLTGGPLSQRYRDDSGRWQWTYKSNSAYFRARDCIIARNTGQIVANFYAAEPEDAGDTLIFKSRVGQEYQFKPNVGDLVMFNSLNGHRIYQEPVADGKPRIWVSIFIGRMPGGEILLWS